jgi:hypothetical protein
VTHQICVDEVKKKERRKTEGTQPSDALDSKKIYDNEITRWGNYYMCDLLDGVQIIYQYHITNR